MVKVLIYECAFPTRKISEFYSFLLLIGGDEFSNSITVGKFKNRN